ncbi:hypothetical protein [Microbacterium terricola]|uniref:VCBS repeat-containing protein n=1 Tax=Microbacterium terricola TaxID=344163 RepID=A0ABM8DYK2_9MICO|nr:hypothetical protein [Microbacterium terricola]UYK38644.1 hypothetical protein OAU46_07920 [Microbacterium terricola]BDV30669.1 hypothetical protein Microterr_13290 [Microbacterium terricola]
MRVTSLIASCACIALAGALIAAVPAAAAPTIQSKAQVPVGTTVDAGYVDVDGDGKKDKVAVKKVAANKYRVAVRTATQQTDSTTITSTIEQKGWAVLADAARLDDASGHELMFVASSRDISGGMALSYVVLTWRKGALTREATPYPRDNASGNNYHWRISGPTQDEDSLATDEDILGTATETNGYIFYSKDGTRYVQRYQTRLATDSQWTAKFTTSTWSASGWVMSSEKTKTLTPRQVFNSYPGGWDGIGIYDVD